MLKNVQFWVNFCTRFLSFRLKYCQICSFLQVKCSLKFNEQFEIVHYFYKRTTLVVVNIVRKQVTPVSVCFLYREIWAIKRSQVSWYKSRKVRKSCDECSIWSINDITWRTLPINFYLRPPLARGGSISAI